MSSTELQKAPPVNPGKAIAKVAGHSLAEIIENELWKSEQLAKQANILFPVSALDQLLPMHKPSLSVITVSTDPQAKDIYFISGGQLGLSKHVILKMLNAAGATAATRKMTPDTNLNYIRWQALVWGKLPDGTPHQVTGSKAWSWEKCQQEMQPGQAKNYRQFADEQTETKALLRAARAFLNLRTSYSKEELAKPFLIARSVPSLDTSDPEIKRMVAQELVRSSFAVYGPQTPALSPPQFPALPEQATDAEFEEEPGESGSFSHPRRSEASPEQRAEAEAERLPENGDEQAPVAEAESPDGGITSRDVADIWALAEEVKVSKTMVQAKAKQLFPASAGDVAKLPDDPRIELIGWLEARRAA
jgi:hypothetical protein